MEDQLIGFETAKLAKEKGFNIKCKSAFNDLGGASGKGIGGAVVEKEIFYQPSQSLLQKWLRETHNIHTWCSYQEKGYLGYFGNIGVEELNGWFPIYEEALEFTLKQALKLIKNE